MVFVQETKMANMGNSVAAAMLSMLCFRQWAKVMPDKCLNVGYDQGGAKIAIDRRQRARYFYHESFI